MYPARYSPKWTCCSEKEVAGTGEVAVVPTGHMQELKALVRVTPNAAGHRGVFHVRDDRPTPVHDAWYVHVQGYLAHKKTHPPRTPP